MPVKRTINLAAVSDNKIDPKLAIPLVIAIIAVAVLLGKYAVTDRLVAMYRASSEVSSLQAQLDGAYADLEVYTTLEEDYAHYTYSGMTADELSLTSRADVIDMMKRVLWPDRTSGSWSISGNRLTFEVEGETLQQINDLARSIEKDPLVDFCTVTDAAMTETEAQVLTMPSEMDAEEEEEDAAPVVSTVVTQSVKANIIVYLRDVTEDNSQ